MKIVKKLHKKINDSKRVQNKVSEHNLVSYRNPIFGVSPLTDGRGFIAPFNPDPDYDGDNDYVDNDVNDNDMDESNETS